MKYAMLKLHFLAPVHFGTESGHLFDNQFMCLADTFFSAMFLEALADNQEVADKLYQKCKNGQILFSDLMPYNDETYFVPKPVLKNYLCSSEINVQDKEFKKLQYISVEHFMSYIAYLKGEQEFSAHAEYELLQKIFAEESRICAQVKGVEQTMPYEVQSVRFAKKCGLYVIVGYEADADLQMVENLSVMLGYSGLGGRRSSGFGQFEVTMEKIALSEDNANITALNDLLNYEKADFYMLIAAALPVDEQLEQTLEKASYQIIKRSGFTDGRYSNETVKKKNLFVLKSGSCFELPFDGDIYDVSRENMHPVYRYAKGMFIGVKL